jgi:hypothetical protein
MGWQLLGNGLAMKTTESIFLEVIDPNHYDFDDLLYELKQEFGHVSDRTLRHWLKSFDLSRNEEGSYEQSDLYLLRGWINLKRAKVVKTFAQFNVLIPKLLEQHHAAQIPNAIESPASNATSETSTATT